MRHSLFVRRNSYRGTPGWLLSGSPAGNVHRISMFFEHESAARRTFTRFVADPSYRTSMEDFKP